MTDQVQQPQTDAAAPAATDATNAPQQNVNDLTINDLSAMKTIIDIASSRGAFQPKEMMAVGQTYTKLEAFLEQVAKQADAQKAQG